MLYEFEKSNLVEVRCSKFHSGTMERIVRLFANLGVKEDGRAFEDIEEHGNKLSLIKVMLKNGKP